MTKTRYGNLTPSQISSTKLLLRKSIFFLLLCVDPETKSDYKDIDVPEAFRNVQYKLNGLNSLLLGSPELVETMSLLEAALMEYKKGERFNWESYRKLILDAGAKVIQGGGHHD